MQRTTDVTNSGLMGGQSDDQNWSAEMVQNDDFIDWGDYRK